jgi:Phosphotransferase enzyme family
MITNFVPHDRALPQLAIALDGKRMGAHFATHLFTSGTKGHRFVVKSCAIERVRYKPGRNCLVSYKLILEDMETRVLREQVVCSRIYPAGGGESHYQKALRGVFAPTDIGPSLFQIEPLEMVAWLYPNERKLVGLPALADSERMHSEILPKVVAARWGDEWTLTKSSCEVVHYVPEHTLTVRADLALHHRVTGTTQTAVVFGKTYYNGHGYTTYYKMRQLWTVSQTRPTTLRVPRPILYQPELNLLWQEGVEGVTLLACERDGRFGADIAAHYARAGAAVAALHRISLRCRCKVSVDDITARLAALPETIGDQLNGNLPALLRVINALVERAPAMQHAVATLHGDLHPQNIFIGDDIHLIDLDNLAGGPPLRDVGSFVADTIYRALLAGKSVESKFALISRFVGGYAANVPWALEPDELAWFTAAALINERVYRCISRLKIGRAELISDLIDVAERVRKGGYLPC